MGHHQRGAVHQHHQPRYLGGGPDRAEREAREEQLGGAEDPTSVVAAGHPVGHQRADGDAEEEVHQHRREGLGRPLHHHPEHAGPEDLSREGGEASASGQERGDGHRRGEPSLARGRLVRRLVLRIDDRVVDQGGPAPGDEDQDGGEEARGGGDHDRGARAVGRHQVEAGGPGAEDRAEGVGGVEAGGRGLPDDPPAGGGRDHHRERGPHQDGGGQQDQHRQQEADPCESPHVHPRPEAGVDGVNARYEPERAHCPDRHADFEEGVDEGRSLGPIAETGADGGTQAQTQEEGREHGGDGVIAHPEDPLEHPPPGRLVHERRGSGAEEGHVEGGHAEAFDEHGARRVAHLVGGGVATDLVGDGGRSWSRGLP